MAIDSKTLSHKNTLDMQVMPEHKHTPRWLRSLLKNPVSILGAVLVILFALIALFAPLIAPASIPSQPYQIPRDGFMAEPQAPTSAEPFGTTQGQYNIFYGVVWGTRTAFMIGLTVTGLNFLIGGLVGSISAYIGGWADEIIQRIVEIFLAFPFLLAALTLATILGAKIQNGLVTVDGVFVVTFGWPGYARLIRGDVLAVKELDYVLAARSIGMSDRRILFRHILPNAFYSLLVVASLDIGTNVLTFAALSFLGLGANEGYADWGQLLSYARNWIPTLDTHWWIVVFPGMALLLFVLAFNLIGDAFRDALDPKMVRR